jgi:exopolysaccharide biosynthesis polyprenyl glycosylphosphotransferase
MGIPIPEKKFRIRSTSINLRASERRLLLAIVDFLLLILALIASLVIAAGLRTSFIGLLGAWKWLVTLAVTWFIFASIFDVYNLARAASTTYGMRAAAAAAGLTSVVYLMIPWLTPTLVNRSYGFLFAGFSVLLIVGWRVIYAQLFTHPTFQNRAIIMGAGPGGIALANAMRSEFAQQDANPFRGTGHVLLGFVTEQSSSRTDEVAGLQVLGQSDDLVRLTRELNVDEVILAMSREHPIRSELNEAILDCCEIGIPVTSMSTIYERLTGRVPVEFVGWDVETITSYEDKPFWRFYSLAKRSLDLLIGFVGLLFLAGLIPPIALANRLTSPGPLFYGQQRVGKGARPFRMIKFRSMMPDAEETDGAVWAQQDDDRVTLAGRWLRKLHLDELPQVYNVLLGDMSLIGPRPERPKFVAILSRDIPFYRARHCVRPGITGWAQIHQDYGSSVEDAQVKLEFDLYYIKKSGLYLELVILLRTITKVLGFRGR